MAQILKLRWSAHTKEHLSSPGLPSREVCVRLLHLWFHSRGMLAAFSEGDLAARFHRVTLVALVGKVGNTTKIAVISRTFEEACCNSKRI